MSSFARSAIGKRVQNYVQQEISRCTALTGGSVGQVWKVEFKSGEKLVVKYSQDQALLAREAHMLQYLAQHTHLPIAHFRHLEDDLLFLYYVENDGVRSQEAERQVARSLLNLHRITCSRFGFEVETTIGPLRQKNIWHKSWINFFGENRLNFMANIAYQRGFLTLDILRKLDRLIAKLPEYLTEPTQPVLLHGDIWTGNVLYHQGQLAAIIDPALSFGHWEMDIAYAHFFDSFSESFYEEYSKVKQLDKEFYSTRLLIYYLYPLLVHCAIFGGDYITQTDHLLNRINR